MDNYMSIFNGILSTDGTFLDIYLNSLDEHKKFAILNNDEAGLLQHVTSLLSASTTRILGVRLLDKILENCSINALDKKGHLWTTMVLKACNDEELERNADIIFKVLNKLVTNSEKCNDFAKSFVSNHLSKIYESVTNVPLSITNYSLQCIENCLRVYPAASGHSRGVIERFLWKNIDHIDYAVVQNCGKCLHLLQQVKGGGVQGINHKTQWKIYQLQLLGAIHNVYNVMFANCSEIYDDKIEQEKLPWEKELIEFDNEPVKKEAQIYIRCRNLVTYLSIALKEPFPVEKPILVKKILNVIVRGLSVNCLMCERNPIADNIALSILLPNLHIDLLNLLDVAVSILRGHILPYAELILGLLVDSLKWSSAKNINGIEKNLISLRANVYDTLTLWCKVFSSGNLCETFAEHLFQEILRDITPAQNEFTLQVLSGSRKHMSKKARKELHSVQNNKPKSSATQSKTDNAKQQELCIAALECLQEILSSVGNFLKPTILKKMQTTIVRISGSFYADKLKNCQLYSSSNCRIEIYNTLYSILMATHYLCPPPTEFVLAIIQSASTRDENLKVRHHCGLLIKNVEKIVHPQKESLLFKIEARDIRNTFIKMGQENLLQDFEFNALVNENNIDDDIVLEVSSSENSALEPDNVKHTNNIPEVISSENSALEQDNVKQTNDIPEVIENEEFRNHKSDDTIEACDSLLNIENYEEIENQTSIADDDAIDKDNTIVSMSENVEIIPTLNPPSNINNETNSTDKVLSLEDNTNTAEVESIDVDMKNDDADEPKTKKQKLSVETDKSDGVNSRTEILPHDEDSILADIASQFVDELD